MQGHIHKRMRATKDGRQVSTWYVVVEMNRGPDGRRRQKWHGGFRTRREAEAAKAKLVNEVHAGVYLEPAKTTLEEWIESSWLPTMRTQVKPSTWDSYMRNLRLHVVPRIGHRPLQQLSPAILNVLYAELMESGRKNGSGGGLSPKTVRYVHATLHKVLTDAVDAGLLSINPADRARPPKPRVAVQSEMRCWDAGQLAKFLVHVEGHRLQAAFHLAAMTGMRRGEVLGLRWQDIDLEAGRLAVRHTLVSVAYQIRESTPKTHQARVVDLDSGTLEQLRIHQARQEAESVAWGAGFQESDLAFRREDGSPVHPDSFTQTFDAEVRRSHLPRIRLHDLRHSHATIAQLGGVASSASFDGWRLEAAAGRDDPLLGLWLLVATTGCRPGEALGLAWDCVDLEVGAVEIRRARVKGEHNVVTVTTPKTKQGRRVIDLEPEVVAVLRRQRADQAAARLGSGERPGQGEPDWLWPLHPDACDHRWHKAVEAAGVTDIGIHGLRHTWATLALRDGVAPTLVSARLGHRKVSFTLDVYSHAVPDWAKAEASRVNGRLLGRKASVMD
jgi:integrase